MVGDGLNDAPALASAHASMSPIDATQVTQAAADAVFLGERLAPVLATIETSVEARRVMRQNLALSAVYNLFAVPLAMFGLLTPLIAAAAMSGSSLLVTLNALRTGKQARGLGRGRAMTVLLFLVPLALALGFVGLMSFLWSLKSGQYDDLDGAAQRVLSDDDIEEERR